MPYIDNVGEENTSSIDIHHENVARQPSVLSHGFPVTGRSSEKQIPPLLPAKQRPSSLSLTPTTSRGVDR
jgi:hypothetical protein